MGDMATTKELRHLLRAQELLRYDLGRIALLLAVQRSEIFVVEMCTEQCNECRLSNTRIGIDLEVKLTSLR